ncbi:MAG: hypothetical protein ACTSPB_01265 [Candidatus Thorarchaeota archaeon]
MCRGCFFVKIDIPSGGDIDGCYKKLIIEDLVREAMMHIVGHQSRSYDVMGSVQDLMPTDDESCFEGIPDYEGLSYKEANSRFWDDREKAHQEFTEKMKPIVEKRVWTKLEDYGWKILRVNNCMQIRWTNTKYKKRVPKTG